MSAGGSIVGGVIGAVIGGYLGGPQGAALGYSIGSGVGSYVTADNIEGSRLNDVRQTGQGYGIPITKGYGLFRTKCPVIWPANFQLIEQTSRSSAKGGGPEMIEYSYEATCAVLVSEGPIAGIRKIWFDDVLVYDLSLFSPDGETPDPVTTVPDIVVSTDLMESKITVYTGSETQLPDGLIEAEEGLTNAPAYRGRAYIVFDAIDVTRYGRMPNVTVEAVENGYITSEVRNILAVKQVPSWSWYLHGAVIDGEWILGMHDIDYDGFDTLAEYLDNKRITDPTLPPNSAFHFITSGKQGAYSPFGAYLEDGSVGPPPWDPNEDGLESGHIWLYYMPVVTDIKQPEYPDIYFGDGCDELNHRPGWVMVPNPTGTDSFKAIMIWAPVGSVPPLPDYTQFYNNCYVGSSPVVVIEATPLVRVQATRKPICAPRCLDAGDPCDPTVHSVRVAAGSQFCINCDGEIITDPTFTGITGNFRQLQRHKAVGVYGSYATPVGPILDLDTSPPEDTKTWWEAQYALAVARGDIPAGLIYNTHYPDDTTEACLSEFTARWFVVQTTNLKDVISDICESSGLAATDYDVTAISDTIEGYAIDSPKAGRAGLTPLMTAYALYAVEIDGKLAFKQKTNTVSETIPDAALITELSVVRNDSLEPPKAVRVSYLNELRGHEIQVQTARRFQAPSNSEIDVSLNLVMTDDAAAQVADILLQEAWQINAVELSVPLADYHALNSGSVVTVDDADPIDVRLSNITYGADGVMQCSGVQQLTDYQSSAVGIRALLNPGSAPITMGLLVQFPIHWPYPSVAV